jgi:hypothetical protein
MTSQVHVRAQDPGISLDEGLLAQWRAVLAMVRADRANVVVMTLAPRAAAALTLDAAGRHACDASRGTGPTHAMG